MIFQIQLLVIKANILLLNSDFCSTIFLKSSTNFLSFSDSKLIGKLKIKII